MTVPKYLRINIISFILLLLLVSSCGVEQNNKTPEVEVPEIGDGGFLSDEPCGPPCFWNITPSITTQDQVLEILQARDLFDQCDFFDNSKESGDRGFICRPVVIVTFQENSDIVSGVGFGPSQEITVEEVMSEYDAPDAVLVTTASVTEIEPRTAMILYYDDLNAKLSLVEQVGPYELTSTTHVENIAYFDQSSYESTRRYSQEWTGYGMYDLYNP